MINEQFLPTYGSLQARALRYLQYSKTMKIGEENVKTGLILPLLMLLGYNIFDIEEICAEYKADSKISRNTKNADRVDYAVFYGRKREIPIIFIEAKDFNLPLNSYIGQLKQYYASTLSVKYAILTNGEDWWFFRDYENKNIMDDTPYWKMKMSKISGYDIKMLEEFSKENMGSTLSFV